jgi:hypothetical protein
MALSVPQSGINCPKVLIEAHRVTFVSVSQRSSSSAGDIVDEYNNPRVILIKEVLGGIGMILVILHITQLLFSQ